MIRPTFLAFALLLVGICCLAQQQAPSDPNPSSQSSSGQGSTSQNSKSRSTPAKSSTNPGSAAQDSSGQAGVGEPEAEESSSRDTRTDITPPPDDAKNHPFSKSAAADLEPAPPSDTTGIQEFHLPVATGSVGPLLPTSVSHHHRPGACILSGGKRQPVAKSA